MRRPPTCGEQSRTKAAFCWQLTEVCCKASCTKSKIESYKRLVDKRLKRVRRLAVLAAKPVIRGSIRIQGNRCGTKGCRCRRKEDPIRGRRANHSILLTKDKDVYSPKAIGNYKKIMNALLELSDVNFTILRYYSRRLKD